MPWRPILLLALCAPNFISDDAGLNLLAGGVTASDFYVRTTYFTPNNQPAGAWSIGIAFSAAAEREHRIRERSPPTNVNTSPSRNVLQNFIAQYSFVVPASDGWMSGFTFWDDDQGTPRNMSALGSSTGLALALGHTTANQWQTERVIDVADFQTLGLTPGTQANWTLLVYNGVVMLADSSGRVLGTEDNGKSGVGDVTAKLVWSPGSGAVPSLSISVSDFQVWNLLLDAEHRLRRSNPSRRLESRPRRCFQQCRKPVRSDGLRSRAECGD